MNICRDLTFSPYIYIRIYYRHDGNFKNIFDNFCYMLELRNIPNFYFLIDLGMITDKLDNLIGTKIFKFCLAIIKIY